MCILEKFLPSSLKMRYSIYLYIDLLIKELSCHTKEHLYLRTHQKHTELDKWHVLFKLNQRS